MHIYDSLCVNNKCDVFEWINPFNDSTVNEFVINIHYHNSIEYILSFMVFGHK
jgi:hypothetical protein